MAGPRKRRETLTPQTEDVGPLWLVRGGGNEEHVRAQDVLEAIEVFAAATGHDPEAYDMTRVTYVQRVAATVHSLPASRGGSDSGGS